ncbi:helix-turn-helix domain-containing protein [Pseudomonas fluorescens]|uniref:IclR family transcriptional regulator n=1 Tax=Pseudomonas fluorescens TaxID=294 RepID=A0A0F4UZI2_PSEFL|nr:helix-turn-helix domain-containing protein [Pseudomonas fluorescens]KJZ61680.1 IclR family transcriptional regulator [Pseudomonas fluorescens]
MNRTVSAAARVLRVLKALKGHTVTGLSNSELAYLTQDSPSNITRAMQTLIEEGLAVKLDNGRFAHSVGVLQIAQAHAEHMVRLTGRMQEINQRIAAGSIV